MELWNVIRELIGDGHSVLLTTQYLEEADRLANRVAVVDGGRVVANDTTAALKARLGDSVIEITMPDEAAAIKAAQLLSRIPTDAVEREGSLLRLSSGQPSRLVMEALRQLDDHDLAPAGLSVREPSLDDVFLALTGHHAEDAAVPAGAAAAVA
jgi:ABC-type multidrug transport system ATPase subunit